MKRITTIAISLGFVALAATGCDENEDCEKLATHLADVLVAEKGEQPKAELRDKMIRKTTEECTKSPPSPEALECAMAASTSEAIKECDSKDSKE
jgi:hypothetical protein